MKKRASLIPLLILNLCGGISLSSGLYYYEIEAHTYLIPLLFVAVSYYVLLYFFREFEKKEIYVLSIEMLFLLFISFILKPMIGEGVYHLLETISSRIQRFTNISLGDWSGGDEAMVGLAICCLVSLVTIISLWLYESEKSTILVALPSFLLFTISIMADGVPYEMCFVAYGIALVCFLGMGLRGGMKRLLLLFAGTGLTTVICFQLIYWPQTDAILRGMDVFLEPKPVSQETTTPVKKDEEQPKGRENQTINFGQYNLEGDIFYSGTIQLTLESDSEFNEPALFLRGFIGEVYNNDYWYGEMNGGYRDVAAGNYFKKDNRITINPVFDVGEYFPYSVEQTEFKRLLKNTYELSPKNKKKFKDELKVEDDLERDIRRQIIKNREYKTMSSAVSFVLHYLADNYTYTLHPGPLQENELEKFMFDTRRGYCTHFASSAIMIFRTMGVPARLVQGYMVDGVQIEPNQVINVFDSDAHAWVEIYVNDAGWVPVDVTPYTNGVHVNERTDLVSSEEDEETEEEIEPELEEESSAEEEDWIDDEWADEEWEDEEWEDESEVGEEEVAEDGEEALETTIPDDNTVISSTSEGNKYKIWLWLLVPIALVVGGIGFISLGKKRKIRHVTEELQRKERNGKLLYINDSLQGFWKRIGIQWSYLDSNSMTKEIVKVVRSFVPLMTDEAEREMEQKVHGYVIGVYHSRFAAVDIDMKQYQECVLWLQQFLRAVQLNTDKKYWKRYEKYNMVKVIMTMKFNEEDGGKKDE